ncbi:MAG: ABC transporter ATP-binding protein [Betaproteobacteria bacterium]
MLRLQGVDAGYGAVQVLWNATLGVAAGEIVSIVGRNGVGKSTTLKAIVGLADVKRGEIVAGDRSLRRMATADMAACGIGYVAQEREICPDLTVEENLRLALLATRRPRDRLGPIYERFPRLQERSRQRAGSLSGGERKILAFARIMLLEPSVYLIDEPTEGLMPSAVVEIGALIRGMRESGAAVLLVEQNLGVVRELSDRIYLMNVGRIEKAVTTLGDAEAAQYLGV